MPVYTSVIHPSSVLFACECYDNAWQTNHEANRAGMHILMTIIKNKQKKKTVYRVFSHVIILQARFNDFDWLETNHSYIQWLFPSRKRSVFNDVASPLTDVEICVIRSDAELRSKICNSFDLILNFFGRFSL